MLHFISFLSTLSYAIKPSNWRGCNKVLHLSLSTFSIDYWETQRPYELYDDPDNPRIDWRFDTSLLPLPLYSLLIEWLHQTGHDRESRIYLHSQHRLPRAFILNSWTQQQPLSHPLVITLAPHTSLKQIAPSFSRASPPPLSTFEQIACLKQIGQDKYALKL